MLQNYSLTAYLNKKIVNYIILINSLGNQYWDIYILIPEIKGGLFKIRRGKSSWHNFFQK